ncbi:MAG: hypothetical protein M1814_003152 [Vezdaea aestivalis]|nr:MAG: hypothetical protein M1814_003152 [Vezdaea aestivalis]
MSGQYGFLPRLLYYLLLIAALALRHHPWLATAALGTAMTYAATAAVHVFALFGAFANSTGASTPRDGADVDLYAIFIVVAAGATMLPPILNWSRVIRENEARIVVDPRIFSSPSLALCQVNTGDKRGVKFLPEPEPLSSLDFYSRCHCADLCGVISVNIPLRTGQGLQAQLAPEGISRLTFTEEFQRTLLVAAVILLLVLINGVLVTIESRWSQHHVRNWIFWSLTGSRFDRLHKYSRRTTDLHAGDGRDERPVHGLYFQAAREAGCSWVLCLFHLADGAVSANVLGIARRQRDQCQAVSRVGVLRCGNTWVGAAFVVLAGFLRDINILVSHFVDKHIKESRYKRVGATEAKRKELGKFLKIKSLLSVLGGMDPRPKAAGVGVFRLVAGSISRVEVGLGGRREVLVGP